MHGSRTCLAQLSSTNVGFLGDVLLPCYHNYLMLCIQIMIGDLRLGPPFAFSPSSAFNPEHKIEKTTDVKRISSKWCYAMIQMVTKGASSSRRKDYVWTEACRQGKCSGSLSLAACYLLELGNV